MVDVMTSVDATLEALFPSLPPALAENSENSEHSENSENSGNSGSTENTGKTADEHSHTHTHTHASSRASPGYTVYPEELLHVTPSANKHFLALQSLTCSFIDSSSANGETDVAPGSIVQFHQTHLDALSRQKVDFWHEKEHSVNADSALETGRPSGPSHNSAASSLFAWSSSDKSIEARKREFQRKAQAQSQKPSTKATDAAGSKPHETASGTKKPAPARSSFGRRLNSVVEKESHRFIQDRIEVIKAHHLQQAARKTDERRRHDHEMHLRRVELKEEKYANALKAAIALQSAKRNSGFFGSLFGPKPVSQSFTLDITDGTVPLSSSRALTPKSSQGVSRNSGSATPEAMSRPLSANAMVEKSTQVSEEKAQSQQPRNEPEKPSMGLSEKALVSGQPLEPVLQSHSHLQSPNSPQISARSSSLEFQEFQFSTENTALSNENAAAPSHPASHSKPLDYTQAPAIAGHGEWPGDDVNGPSGRQADPSDALDFPSAAHNRSSSDLLSL